MKKLLGVVLSMFCATSFLAANGTVDANKENVVASTVEVKTEATEAAAQEVAVADEAAQTVEAAKAKKAEENKSCQEKKSCCGSK